MNMKKANTKKTLMPFEVRNYNRNYDSALRHDKIVNTFINIGIYLLLILMSLFVLIPFYTIIISSFKLQGDILNPVFSWWPTDGKLRFDGYLYIFSPESDIGGMGGNMLIRSFFNTLWMNIPPMLASLFISGLAGFAYAKLDFFGRKGLFSFLLFTMMVPGCTTMVSSYLLYDTIYWTNTPLPFMIPALFGNVGNIFFMRQYFQGIPTEMIEAAKIDGMHIFKIYLKVVIPLSVPVYVSLGLLNFIGRYNDYLGPLMYLNDPDLFTLQLAIKNMTSMYKGEWQIILAACVISFLPLMIIYSFTQKYFLKGITMTSGLKG